MNQEKQVRRNRSVYDKIITRFVHKAIGIKSLPRNKQKLPCSWTLKSMQLMVINAKDASPSDEICNERSGNCKGRGRADIVEPNSAIVCCNVHGRQLKLCSTSKGGKHVSFWCVHNFNIPELNLGNPLHFWWGLMWCNQRGKPSDYSEVFKGSSILSGTS